MNRRMLCLILALMLCLSLVACGTKQPAVTPDAENSAATEAPAATDAAGNPVEAPKAEGEKTDAPASSSEEEEKPAFQPGVDTTLPPDVDVSMGTAEGAEAPVIDDEVPGTQTPTATQPSAQPEETPSQIGDDFDVTTLTYELYNSLSGADQQKVIAMFGSPDDFVRWYKAVEAQYKAEHPDIEIGADGIIDAGALGG